MILENIETILLDIEGTTTPIDFVHQKLFPYARTRMKDFLAENLGSLENEIKRLKTEYTEDFAAGDYAEVFDENSASSIASYANFLIDRDRKSTGIKSLQGKIWQSGYETGELKSEVFADVPPAFKRWTADGKSIAIFSSGSVLAQRLLFANTEHGNLTSYISSYFDTNVGGKKEAGSYLKIACSESFPQVENFLFVSDVTEELDAAREAGMKTLLSIRRGNAPISKESKHRIIHSFDEID